MALWSAPDSTFHGVGICLGDLGTDEHLAGIDLDSCLHADGTVSPWAEPIVAALLYAGAYVEVSPSGGGVKAFFRTAAADAADLRSAFGIDPNKWGSKRTIPSLTNGQEHPPAIEIYLGDGRYFTVTARPWPDACPDVTLLDRPALDEIAALVQQATGAPSPDEPHATRPTRRKSRDGSRSAIAFRLGAQARQEGATFDAMCETIRSHPNTADWYREKGVANDKRELHNIWRNTAPDSRPIITVLAGHRHAAADAGLVALSAAGVAFYRRDTTLVRIARIKAKASDGALVTSPAILTVPPAMLARVLGQSARWERRTADGEPRQIDPPVEVVDQILTMTDEWPFPPLRGLIDTPTLRADGSLLQSPGYDPASGYFLHDPPPMPTIADRPSRQAALDALALLNNDLLREFPFATDASRSVALSMLLTPVLRAATAVVPAHVITAPEAGSGKSFLQDIAAVIATGERCAVMSMSLDAGETEKRLIGAALAQSPIIALDNVSVLVMGDFLCQVTERPLLLIRPLGTSNKVRIANSFTTFVNGNNLVVAADNVRRCVRCSLDAGVERPEERSFTANPVKLVLADRGKYVAACLTIARAYIAAGRPGKLPPYPSYEEWSDLVRSAIVWLGWADPIATVAAIRGDDPVRAERSAAFAAWAADLQPEIGYQTAELVTEAEAWAQGQRRHPELFAALYAVAASRGGTQQIDPMRLAHWLRKNCDTIADGWKLIVDRGDRQRPRWKLTARLEPESPL
jgi:putative DNA primase/helicase